ncbi:MAG TPA: hypothetical protein VI731_02220 [Bacteroidia bacterium]|nr:hypothetical protein [Bacteroidia bacterium]
MFKIRDVLFLLPVILASCGGTSTRHDPFADKLNILPEAEVESIYLGICARLDKKRDALQQQWKNAGMNGAKRKIVLDSTRKLLFNTLCDSLFVCWYGTPWDFNGTSHCPRKGQIACGYFVTTVLEQAGFRIERTWLAQQASGVMIRHLCASTKIKTITNNQTKKLVQYIQSRPDGIFVIGLDNHTGFIIKQKGSLDFVDAGVWPHGKVAREPLNESQVVNDSKFYVAGELLYSNETLIAWLQNKPVGKNSTKGE